MSNSFYKLFEKIQNLKEQDEMNPNKVVQPDVSGGDSSAKPSFDPNMQLGVKDDISGEAEQSDAEDIGGDENTDNLSVPEGSVDTDQILMSLNKIKKMIPKFQSMDKDKADQLDDLLKQTSSLVSSFEAGEGEDDSEQSSDMGDTEEDTSKLMGDKKPSFGDKEGPPVAPQDNMGADASTELPAISPADQKPPQS